MPSLHFVEESLEKRDLLPTCLVQCISHTIPDTYDKALELQEEEEHLQEEVQEEDR